MVPPFQAAAQQQQQQQEPVRVAHEQVILLGPSSIKTGILSSWKIECFGGDG